jgi:hypothetical protein
LIKTQYTINQYNPQDDVNLIDSTIKVQEAMEKDSKMGSFISFIAQFVAVGLLHADTLPASERPDAFAPFWDLKSLITTACPTMEGTLLSLAQAMLYEQSAGK